MIPMFIPNETEIANETFSQNSHSEFQTDGPVNTIGMNVRNSNEKYASLCPSNQRLW